MRKLKRTQEGRGITTAKTLNEEAGLRTAGKVPCGFRQQCSGLKMAGEKLKRGETTVKPGKGGVRGLEKIFTSPEERVRRRCSKGGGKGLFAKEKVL